MRFSSCKYILSNNSFTKIANNVEIFDTDSAYDHSTNYRFTIDWWIVSKGQEKICLWPIFKSTDHKVDLPLFSYYFGPVWSDSYMQSSNHSQLSKRNNVFEIFEILS